MGEIMIGRREEWCGFHCPLFWGPWTKDRKRHEYPGMTSLSLGGGSAIVVSGAKPSQKVKIIPTYIKTSAALVHFKNNRFCYSHYNFQVITIYIANLRFYPNWQNKTKTKNMNKERCMCIANHQKQWQRLFRKWWTRGHGPIFIQSLLTGVKGSHLIVTHS